MSLKGIIKVHVYTSETEENHGKLSPGGRCPYYDLNQKPHKYNFKSLSLDQPECCFRQNAIPTNVTQLRSVSEEKMRLWTTSF
jgi:hypothetical protein